MANIERIRVAWSGFVGGPGVSTFYATDAASLLAPLRAMFNSMAGRFPGVVTHTFPSSGDTIDATSGALVSAWVGSAPAPTTGTDTGGYAAPAGAIIRWQTGTIIHGHRLVGRTFLVPLAKSNFDVDGTLLGTSISSISAAVQTFVTASAGNMVVWSRPGGGTAGGFSAVNSAVVPDKSMILRSRRD